MTRLLWIVFAAALLMLVAPAAHSQDTMHDHWRRMGDAHEAQDWRGVISNGRLLRADKNWSRLPASARWPVITREGEAHLRLGRHAQARRLLVQALRITPEPDRYVPLFYLFHAELGLEAWMANSAILLEFQRIKPEQVDSFAFSTLNRIVLGLERDGEEDSYAALVTLLATEYQPPQPTTHLDGIFLRYAGLLARDGRTEAAMMQLEQVLYSSARIRARSSRDFAPLWSDPRFERLTDPVAGEEASLARAVADAVENPERLAPLRAQVVSLMRLGRLEEAVALGEALLVGLDEGEAFLDFDDRAAWLMNDLASLFYVDNRVEEADALMARAAALMEHGQPNVSQVINSATMLSYQSRHAEALAVLEWVGDASDHGRMLVRSVAACSRHHLGQTQARDRLLAQMASDRFYNPAAYQRALICIGDFDGAASLLVERLNDPAHRAGALRALQERRLLINPEVMPFAAQLETDFAALKQRPDVRSAIEQAGRVEPVELYQPYLGAF